MSNCLLMTGSTGLLGRYLVRSFLEKDQPLALLVRGAKGEDASERIEQIVLDAEKELGKRLRRPVLIEGDVRLPMLGITSDELKWISKNCSILLHTAASLKFVKDGLGEPFVTNLDGNLQVLELMKSTGLRKLHYVSTAYVCGLREGRILESDLDCGQAFRNDYEESKFQAEKIIRNATHIDELTVYRPAVISGDSRTGYTHTYHGIYLYLRLISMLVPRQQIGADGLRHTPLRLPMTGEEERNVVPVDWVANVISALFEDSRAHGKTFHLVPEQRLTPRQIIEAAYSYFRSTGIEYVGYTKIDPSTYNSFESEMLPGIAMYEGYNATDPVFDRTNLERFASELRCPVIDEATLHRYIRFGENDLWGKRRRPNPKGSPVSAQ